MAFPTADALVTRLKELERLVRDQIVASRKLTTTELSGVDRSSSADTIYAIDALVEPVIEEYCEHWGKETPLVLVGEGFENESTGEDFKVFPHGTAESDAVVRVIMDPIDGTRGIMYDKRPAWSLAAAGPNKGSATRLSDCIASVMTELPTSKMGWSDVLWATRGGGAHASRVDLRTGTETPLPLHSSRATTLAHGFAMVSHFFPATKVEAGKLMNHILEGLGGLDPTLATIFDDQYICTGGQFYSLAIGVDRFNADVRPQFYQRLGITSALECHPYDIAGLLVAEEAGVLITDANGGKLDAPLNTTSGVSWIGYANAALKAQIEPLILNYLNKH